MNDFSSKVYQKLMRVLSKQYLVGGEYHQQIQINGQIIQAAWKGQHYSPISDDNRLAIIVGAARTGTTLLQGLLCSDPNTNPLISESVFFRQYIELHRATAIYKNNFPGHYFSNDADLDNFISVSIDLYLDHIQNIHQCSKLVLKHPALTREITQLMDIFPNVRVVCLIRDPRAIVASLVRWKAKLLAANSKHPLKLYRFRQFINFTNSFYAPLFNNFLGFYAERILFVRYEDLVSNTSQVVQALEKFTGLDLSSYSPNQDWSSSLFDYSDVNTPVSASATPLYGKGISKSRMEAYKKQLSPRQIKKIEHGCRAIIDMFEYNL